MKVKNFKGFVLRPGFFIALTATFPLLTGIAVLISWIIGKQIPIYQDTYVPMAPSTAILFILYSTSVLLRIFRPTLRRISAVEVSLGVSGLSISSILFVLSISGIYFDIEHFGIPISGSIMDIPYGHMSPLSAFCFMMIGVSYIITIYSSPRFPVRTLFAFWLLSVILLLAIVLVIAYLFDTPLLYGTRLIPPAMTTSIAFFSLGLSILVYNGMHRLSKSPWDASARRNANIILLAFLILGTVIFSAGTFYIKRFEVKYFDEKRKQLSVAGELTAITIEQWRRERLGDAYLLSANHPFTRLAMEFLQNPTDIKLKVSLESWMSAILNGYGYSNINIYNSSGQIKFCFPSEGLYLQDLPDSVVNRILLTDQVSFIDMYKSRVNNKPLLSIMIPVPDKISGKNNLIELQYDPQKQLFPHLFPGPLQGQTTETFIFRRVNDSIQILSRQRFHNNAPLEIMESMQSISPQMFSVLENESGLIEGVDYRGQPIYAYIRHIADSPWFITTKMDKSEFYQPIKEKQIEVLAISLIIILIAGSGVSYLWRSQRMQFYHQQMKTGEALRGSEAKFAKAFHAKNILMAISEVNGKFIEANEFTFEYTGYSREEFIGETARNLNIFRDPEILDEIRTTVQLGESISNYEADILTKTGRIQTGLLTIETFEISGHRYLLTILNDITAIKQAEKAILQMNVELEQRVRDRTAQLATLNYELEAFIHSVSHDLRAPLRQVEAYANFLLEDLNDIVDPNTVKLISIIKTGLKRMDQLILDLLSVSKVSRLEIRYTLLDMNEIVRDVIHELNPDEEKTSIEFKVTDLPAVRGDEVLLKQVWTNLISNSIKYTSRKPRRIIEISGGEHGDFIVYTIKDNGDGFNMEYKEKLFKIFQRLHREDDFEGTGAGLAIVDRIIKRHHGEIHGTGEPGIGAEFTFSLPIV